MPDPNYAMDPSMAGLLGNAQLPQMQPWQGGVGLFSSALKDAAAYLGNRPEDATNVAGYGQQMRQYNQLQARQNAIGAMASADPNARAQGYKAAMMLGIDPTPFMKMQADKAMPAMLSAMQPQTSYSLSPAVAQQIQAGKVTNAAPDMSMVPGMNIMDAMKAANSPELSQVFAPTILQNQMEIANKTMRPATVAQKVQGGYSPTDPVMTDVYGNLSSPVKPQAAVQQGYDIVRNTPRTQEDIVKDRIAQEGVDKPIVVAPGSTLMSPKTGLPVGGQAGGGLPMVNGKLSSNLSDYPPQMQGVIQGMLEGKIAPPQGAALRAPQTLQLIQAAAAIDPKFDETTWSARNKMATDSLGNGKWGQSMNALGTATQHVAALGNSYKAGTFGTSIPGANWVLNGAATAFGSPGATVYQDTAHKVGEEYTRAYRGAGGSEADIKSSMDALSPNASNRTKDAVIDENMNLARDKMAENVEQYNRTMGTNKKISDFVSPQTRAAYAARGIDIDTGNKIGASGPSGSPQIAAAGTTATGPGGKTLTSDGKGGWY